MNVHNIQNNYVHGVGIQMNWTHDTVRACNVHLTIACPVTTLIESAVYSGCQKYESTQILGWNLVNSA